MHPLTGANRLHACVQPQPRTSRCAQATSGRTHMHHTLHTPLPHTYTHDQQQQLGDGSSESGSDDSDDSGDNNSVIESFLQWFGVAAFSHVNSEALAAESCQPGRLFDGCHRRHIGSASIFRQLRQSAVSVSTVMADRGSSCHVVCCVGAMHRPLASWRHSGRISLSSGSLYRPGASRTGANVRTRGKRSALSIAQSARREMIQYESLDPKHNQIPTN